MISEYPKINAAFPIKCWKDRPGPRRGYEFRDLNCVALYDLCNILWTSHDMTIRTRIGTVAATVRRRSPAWLYCIRPAKFIEINSAMPVGREKRKIEFEMFAGSSTLQFRENAQW